MEPLSQTSPPRAIVIGNSGGIGAALEHGLVERGYAVTGLSRTGATGADGPSPPVDLNSEKSIEAAADALQDRGPFSVILVATGLLHDEQVFPEKALRDLDPAALFRLFAINAVGPALVAKHFVQLLPRRGQSIFAALSARVGSISDNRLGGWYGYRASKAALNMLIRTAAIEMSRSRPEAICVTLHPGTVATRLSGPFQKNVAPNRLFTPSDAAAHLLKVIEALKPSDTGRCFAWDGREIDP